MVSVGLTDFEYVVDPAAQHPNRNAEIEGTAVALFPLS
jgi:hypothetical protein